MYLNLAAACIIPTTLLPLCGAAIHPRRTSPRLPPARSLPPGTITNAAKVLHAEGAREVYACATHAVFSPPAVERLSSGVFQVRGNSRLPADAGLLTAVDALIGCIDGALKLQPACTSSDLASRAPLPPRCRPCRSPAAALQCTSAQGPALPAAAPQEVIVANTIPVPPEHQFPELTVLSGKLKPKSLARQVPPPPAQL